MSTRQADPRRTSGRSVDYCCRALAVDADIAALSDARAHVRELDNQLGRAEARTARALAEGPVRVSETILGQRIVT